MTLAFPPRMYELRPFQKEALGLLEKPGSVICVAPTGSGKSLIYERLARRPGAKALLVTPLIALARQQADRLRAVGVETALGAGPSSQGAPPQGSGVWIVSPEKLLTRAVRAKLDRWAPNLLVVDECHCVWDWGARFRPAFMLIPELLRGGGFHRSLWLTATLPLEAREELRRWIPAPLHEIGEFALPENLFLRAEKCSWIDRSRRMFEWIGERESAGIIFVQTRESARRLTALLLASGRRAVHYHAGMSAEERRATEAMIAARIPHIVVATSAFGMGMDHPHLEWALLWQAPPTLLSLAQAIGRAGRDRSRKSEALILWDEEDFRLLEWIAGDSERGRSELARVRDFLSIVKCRRLSLQSYFDGNAPLRACRKCDCCNS